MPNLAVLHEARIFPPRKFQFVVWAATLAVAVYGLAVTTSLGAWTTFAWVVIALIAIWQIWGIRWVQVDSEGVRARNIFHRGRELRWDQITMFREEEVKLSRKPYVILYLSNRGAGERLTKMELTSDQVGFDILREIVRGAVPEEALGEKT